MTPEEFNKKYDVRDQQREEKWWEVVKEWLTAHPEKFLFFRTYIPGFMDGDPCLPTIELLGAGPGYLGEYYVDSEGIPHYYEDRSFDSSDLPERDQKILKETENLCLADLVKRGFEYPDLEVFLERGFCDYVDEWDVTGTIKLSPDAKRGVVVETERYDCGY